MFSISLIFVLLSVFLTKLLTFGILFSTAVKTIVVANLVILSILFLTSFILALREVSNTRCFFFLHSYFSIKSSIRISVSIIRYFICNSFDLRFIYIVFNSVIFYYITDLVYLYQQVQVIIYQHLIYLL